MRFPVRLPALALAATLMVVNALGAAAADRDRLQAFLSVTGFDVALESIKLSAGDAPRMLGLEAADFGESWSRLTDEVFDVDVMKGMALDILGRTLSDEALSHGAEFYATDLGQRLVEAERVAGHGSGAPPSVRVDVVALQRADEDGARHERIPMLAPVAAARPAGMAAVRQG